jgi:hypothetical protein
MRFYLSLKLFLSCCLPIWRAPSISSGHIRPQFAEPKCGQIWCNQKNNYMLFTPARAWARVHGYLAERSFVLRVHSFVTQGVSLKPSRSTLSFLTLIRGNASSPAIWALGGLVAQAAWSSLDYHDLPPRAADTLISWEDWGTRSTRWFWDFGPGCWIRFAH